MGDVTALEELRLLLGDAYFVPCFPGTKKPKLTYKERPKEKTQSDAYRFHFQDANIAVYLGKPSDGLCAIDFDRDEDLEAFVAVNPKLCNSLLSCASRGAQIWVRISGEYPRSVKALQFEWRADGNLSTIYGRHEKGMDYRLLCREPPAVVAFEEIVWPEGWELPWLDDVESKLRERYGEPFYTNDKGAMTGINEAYWAGLHAVENTLLYEPNEKSFYGYDASTGRHEVESMDLIRTKISDRMLLASREANAFDLQKRRTATTLNNVIAHLRGIVERRGVFAEKRNFIHLANGVMVFNGAEADLREFSPDFYSRNQSPIAFDENAKCERFLNELVLPAVHPDDVELLQKFAGMFLLGYNRAQRILILDGEGGRGKTQFANVMQGLVGLANVTQLRTKLLAERFELFRYLKKTLLVGVDVDSDFLSSKGASVLKGLVGGDWFDAEQKGGTGSFQMQGNFNVIITSNARLKVRLQGDLSAWKRRLTIVRYESPPPQRKIHDFGGYLVRTEGSGVLNWALLGAQKVLNEIPDSGGDLRLTQRQDDVVGSLLAESDSLRHFLKDRVMTNQWCDLTVTEVVEAYAAYCPERRWKPLPITEIQAKLEGLMLELFGVSKIHSIKRNDRNQRGFHGVKFIEP